MVLNKLELCVVRVLGVFCLCVRLSVSVFAALCLCVLVYLFLFCFLYVCLIVVLFAHLLVVSSHVYWFVYLFGRQYVCLSLSLSVLFLCSTPWGPSAPLGPYRPSPF